MSWYGKNDKEPDEKAILKAIVERYTKEGKEYDGGNLRVIKRSNDDNEN